MPLRDTVISTVTTSYDAASDSVPTRVRSLISPQNLATGIGVARVVIGTTFLAAPRLSVRMLGVDSASAKRMAFLARMTAARDISLGAGTLQAGTGPAVIPWLVVGVGSDVVDAVAIAGAMRSGTTRGVAAAAASLSGAVGAAVGIWTVRGLRRRS